MLSKLQSTGVSNASCDWFGSYLSQRTQVVNVVNSVFDPLPVTVGVPQGLIPGSVLFSPYVMMSAIGPYSLPHYGLCGRCKNCPQPSPNHISDTVIALNEDLLAVARWCCTNSLVINPDKTKLPVIGVPQITRSLPSFLTVKLLGKEIKPVPVAEDLGVIIDSSLCYNEHVTKPVPDCMRTLKELCHEIQPN